MEGLPVFRLPKKARTRLKAMLEHLNKPKKPEPFSFDSCRSRATRCLIPLKCSDKERCLYGEVR